ncbi:MAG: amino acid adenylation domain-containing protein [Elusimicrobiota bacterium]|nr:amino acid adenylation domain-containing protein [Elusimicrobiota bacterium]
MPDKADRFKSLSKEKQKLFELLRAKKSGERRNPGLDGTPLKSGRPKLCFMQEQICFSESLNPGNASYNIPVSLRLNGKLDIEALNLAIQNVAARHEAFRTAFFNERGIWRPELQEVVRLSAAIEDHPGQTGEETINARMLEETQRTFDLGLAPLARIFVFNNSENSAFLHIVMHHLISDGWSFYVFLEEIAESYNAFLSRRAPDLPQAGRQLSEFANWQHRRLAENSWASHLTYWQKELHRTESLELPVDFPRPAKLSTAGNRFNFKLPQSLVRALALSGQKAGATPFGVFFTGFQILLHRYTDQNTFAVGIPSANRGLKGTERIIGPLINPVAVRADFTDDMTVQAALDSSRERILNALEYQDCPFELVVRALNPVRDPSKMPVFQVLFNYQVSPGSAIKMSGLDISPLPAVSRTTKADLELDLLQGTDGVDASFEYSTSLFDSSTIERMAGSYINLLESMHSDLTARVEELPLLTEKEYYKITRSFNSTDTVFTGERCILDCFASQARIRPSAGATVFEGENYSYGELDRLSSLFAARLTKSGVQRGSPVGYHGERCKDLMVAVLGILKAGGAYVPLDPALPKDRIDFMIEDCAFPVIVSQTKWAASLTDFAGKLVVLDDDAWKTGITPAEPVSLADDDLAYIIYTSGTTGRPKGVRVHHGGLRNRLLWMQSEYQLTYEDRILQKTPLSFDVSIWELFWPLMSGSKLVIARPLGHTDNIYLDTIIQTERVTVLHFVPSMLQIFVEFSKGHELQNLRLVFVSGEALPYELKDRFIANFPEVKLHNLYGPTEASVDVTYWDCSQEDPDGRRILPIGRPIANTQIYILDKRKHPVPVGVHGELYIGGVGVAKGYLNRPALTAEKFIPDPFKKTGVLYRTGDLARFLPAGAIEYLGRNDFQVKIRGFRIELGEIETTLTGISGVREAVVAAETDHLGAKRLVAYVTFEKGAALTSREMSRHLADRVPVYMVPSLYIVLESMPLSSNGKIDRKALPKAADASLQETVHEYEAPRTELERRLLNIWQQVLGLPKIGIFDNIFSIGGDSIRTLRIAGLAQDQGLAVTVALILKNQSISELALAIGENKISGAEREKQSLPFELIDEETRARMPNGIEDAYPLAQLQSGMVFHLDLDPSSSLYQNVDSIHIEGPLDLELFKETLKRTVARHPVLRTSFDFTSYSEPLQLVHSRTEIPLEISDWTGLDPEDQENRINKLVELEKKRLFDISRPPLIRFLIHLRTPNSFQLTVPHHHAILDGWSLSALCVEVFWTYQRLLENRDLPIEPPAASKFRDFVRAETGSLKNSDTRKFWLRVCENSSIAKIPGDTVNSTSKFQFSEVNTVIPQPLVDGLFARAKSLQVSLKTMLLSAHVCAIAHLSGETDISTGLVTSGRLEASDGDKVLGLFLNSVPIRVRSDGGSWTELIRKVSEAELKMFPHRRFPLAEIQRLNNGEPPFETLFNFTNFHLLEELSDLPKFKIRDQRSFTRANFPFAASFDLAAAGTGKLNLSLLYDSKRYSSEKIEDIGRLYIRIMDTIVKDPGQPIGNSCLLTDRERQKVLLDFNDTGASDPAGLCLHQLFERQVLKSGGSTAIISDNRLMTYDELNRSANQLARHLQSLGVGPESLVGIAVERSLEMIVSLVAVLKAGGAYVPIDASYPADRIAYMLEDSKVKVLLTQERLLPKMPDTGAQVVCLDRDKEQWAAQNVSNPAAGVSDKDLAYVIYTSGSTGSPKGVMIQHGSLAAYMQEVVDLYDLSDSDHLFQFSSISFDGAGPEIYPPLISGAKLSIRSDRDSLVPVDLHKRFCDLGITKTFLPTAYWHQFVTSIAGQSMPMPPALKAVSIAGEAAQLNKVTLWLDRWGATTSLINLYGPTEATIGATAFKFPVNWRPEKDIVPIGTPIRKVRIYILDSNDQPTPIGVTGEIHIGGRQVARGYLNRPDLTAEKFIPDPFCKRENGRLYKTGDLGAWLPDGNIKFIGRADSQVKIRGFRIEPGEIELRLAEHPKVKEVLVVASAGQYDDRHLVAYIICKSDPVPDIKEFRTHLLKSLPDYMVPAAFVTMDSFPLNANGKVNRKALPSPDYTAKEKAYIAPRTPTEQAVSEIIKEVLGIGRISMTESFFELGGNSLLAIRVIGQCRKLFGPGISLRMLFEFPGIERFAGAIEESGGGCFSERGALIPLTIEGPGQYLICVHGAEGMPFVFRKLAVSLSDHYRVYAFQAPGLFGDRTPYLSIDEYAEHYLSEIRKLCKEAPYVLLGYSAGGVIAHEIAARAQGTAIQPKALFLIDSFLPSVLQSASIQSLFAAMSGTLSKFSPDILNDPRWTVDFYSSLSNAIKSAASTGALRVREILDSIEAFSARSPGADFAKAINLAKIYLSIVYSVSQHKAKLASVDAYIFRAKRAGSAMAQDSSGEWLNHIKGKIETMEIDAGHDALLEGNSCEEISRSLRDFIRPYLSKAGE